MSTTVDLTAALVFEDDGLLSEISEEILEHQGIIFDRVRPTQKIDKKYPVVVVAESGNGDTVEFAENISVSTENVLKLGRVLDLEKLLKCFSGRYGKTEDQLELEANKEEVKLARAVQQGFAKLDLPFVRKWFWPNYAKACCVMTHDVDWLTYSPFHKAVFKGLNLGKVMTAAIKNLSVGKDYGWNIPTMVNLEQKYGVKSTFFFQTRYQPKEQELVDSSLKLMNGDPGAFELGLHGYHSSHKDLEALKTEMETFSRKAGARPKGLRFHVLKFHTPQTWLLETQVGLDYDATFSFNEYFGFRAETCFPFHPFASRRLPLLELPTSFMDWTALYRGRRRSRLFSTLDGIKQSVERFHGALIVNFHNTYINKETFPDFYAVFESLLKQVSSENYWVATASQCAEWWKRRAESKPAVRFDRNSRMVKTDSEIPIAATFGKERLEIVTLR